MGRPLSLPSPSIVIPDAAKRRSGTGEPRPTGSNANLDANTLCGERLTPPAKPTCSPAHRSRLALRLAGMTMERNGTTPLPRHLLQPQLVPGSGEVEGLVELRGRNGFGQYVVKPGLPQLAVAY